MIFQQKFFYDFCLRRISVNHAVIHAINRTYSLIKILRFLIYFSNSHEFQKYQHTLCVKNNFQKSRFCQNFALIYEM